MSSQSPSGKPSTTDQILDLLLDALVERQSVRRGAAAKPPAAPPVTIAQPAAPVQAAPAKAVPAQPAPALAKPVQPASKIKPREPKRGEEGWQLPPKQPMTGMGRLIGRLLVMVLVLTVLVNIPVTRYGVSLARIMPDSASLIIRDGLILKGTAPEIYRLEDSKLRWISSMDAFEHLGLTWDDVHVVDDPFLQQFEKGRPIHVLLKCMNSDHIYRLENDQKRWIKDINTFLAEGHVWDDVRFVSCEYLRGIPDGVPIPENAGTPPQP
jgi:hypothetical protein